MSSEDTGPQRKRSGIYDWRQFRGPTTAIVEAVAEMTESELTAIPPLQQYADTDALETLLTGTDGVEITFQYDGVVVTIDGDGKLAVTVDDQAT